MWLLAKIRPVTLRGTGRRFWSSTARLVPSGGRPAVVAQDTLVEP
ncbi:hypothetical protein ACIHDR_07635 [Nocardia sp. NPDC052278]